MTGTPRGPSLAFTGASTTLMLLSGAALVGAGLVSVLGGATGPAPTGDLMGDPIRDLSRAQSISQATARPRGTRTQGMKVKITAMKAMARA